MSDISRVLSLLDSALGSHRPQKQNEYLWQCKFCHHHKPKLAVNVVSGNWHCWVCNTGGRSLFSLLKKAGGTAAQLRELSKALDIQWASSADPDEEVVLALPAEYKPLWEPTHDYEYRHALRYCTKRGIGAADILKYQLGYCATGEYANRVIVPSFDETGKLNFFVGRSYYDSTMPYKNPPVSKNIVGFESLVSWSFPIVICEGPMDAIAIKRNAIPLFGKTLPLRLQEQIIFNDVRDVFLALDTDALKQATHIAEMFRRHNVNVYVVRLDGKDPNEMGFEKMNEQIRKTERLTFSELVKLKVSLF